MFCKGRELKREIITCEGTGLKGINILQRLRISVEVSVL